MFRATIAIVSAGRARLFTFHRIAHAHAHHADVHVDRFTEEIDLVEDHPRRHYMQFATVVVGEIAHQLARVPAGRLIVCAPTPLLEAVREAMLAWRLDMLAVDVVDHDFGKANGFAVRDQLTVMGLLPARPTPSFGDNAYKMVER